MLRNLFDSLLSHDLNKYCLALSAIYLGVNFKSISIHSLPFTTFSNRQIKIIWHSLVTETSMLFSDPFFTLFNLAPHKYTLHFKLKLHL